ncbi:RNB domain-containing ribonuclease [Gloeothece verrucosa]|uniref:Ribonuclease II n=1 Tax=Gloeothece verrucosa (strain PCC 7822) TaxID=497965 RepID=E0UNP2_GLOV7|nr:RNB domain-containing ribonuclease [Gloeothece verrucosa]ADN18572.1 ribonuclease II [Gloeothece verrucosa PCC 7822]
MRQFSHQVIAELETLKAPSVSKREQVLGFTIDSETSLDLDDAIWIEPIRNGAIIWVHITDVTSMVPFGGAIEKAAIERVETHYLPRKVDPMLPSDLATNKLSLLENKLRPTVTIKVTLDSNAKIVNTEVSLTQLTSLKKFSYTEAEAILNEPSNPFYCQIRYCEMWAQKLYWRRTNIGAIGGTSISGLFLDEEGRPCELRQYKSQQLIQEFMILANTAIANAAAQKQRVLELPLPGLDETNTDEPFFPSTQELDITQETVNNTTPEPIEDIPDIPGADNPILYLNNQSAILKIQPPTYQFRAVNGGWECTSKMVYQDETITATEVKTNKKEDIGAAALSILKKLHQIGAFAASI